MVSSPSMSKLPSAQPLPPQQRKPAQSGENPLAEQLNELLPQTQCTRCGFPSCRDYASALAAEETALNRCPPGGKAGISALAEVLDLPELPLDPECGIEGPRLMAWIDPAECIGCTKCILACPTDAIIGGPRRMHTILPALCTGCELCVPPCPVDCIALTDSPDTSPWDQSRANAARRQFEQRNARRDDDKRRDHDRFGQEASAKLASPEKNGLQNETRKTSIIEAAIARAKERREARARNAGAQGDSQT